MRQIQALLLVILCLALIAQARAQTPQPWQYPQSRKLDIGRLVVHAPQIQAWPAFQNFEALIAVELFPAATPENVLYATLTVSGATRLQLEERLVVITNPQVDTVTFAADGTPAYKSALQNAVQNERIEMPLDVFLLTLDDEVLNSSAATGFSTEPPEILVEKTATILLSVPGKPYLQPLEDTGVELALNANWPLLYESVTKTWYLLVGDLWLTSDKLEGGWHPVTALPPRLTTLSPDGPHLELLAAIPPPQTTAEAPQVAYRNTPTELVVVEGEPVLEPIAGAKGLKYVSNTEAALLRYNERWYFLAAGRWFSTPGQLDDASWRYQSDLPAVFAELPTDHSLAWTRVSIFGTSEARLEALEAQLPRETRAAVGAAPRTAVVYDGEPDFQAIEDSTVARAVNTADQVLLVAGVYYLCREGIWYSAASPQGSWTATADIPPAIYEIPPASPSFAVTDVKASSSSSDDITYTSTGASTSGTYVSGGVVVLSTGWYYPPYLGGFYYPYYPSYGHGQHYNPDTGAFAQKSVWYGPYGGYSYGEGYNPSTGRHGYREVAWDGDDWVSHSEIYSERNNVKTTTDRSFDDEEGKYRMERTIKGEDGEKIKTERTTNVEDGWQKTTRETSEGGSSKVERAWDKEGSLTSSGTFESGDGRSATLSGNYQDGKGSTEIKGSEGGQLKSVAEDGNRATLAKTGDGDMYAGHNGDVYKKTEDGWQQYDRDSGEWQDNNAARTPSTGASHAQQSQRSQAGASAQRAQLERDARARQQGYQRFERSRRRGGRARGGRRGRR